MDDIVCSCIEFFIPAEISGFHSFGNFSRDEKFNAGEYNIIHLPDLSQFDGIILEVKNMLNQKKKQQIIQIIQGSGVPAVSLLEKIPGLYHAGLDLSLIHICPASPARAASVNLLMIF